MGRVCLQKYAVIPKTVTTSFAGIMVAEINAIVKTILGAQVLQDLEFVSIPDLLDGYILCTIAILYRKRILKMLYLVQAGNRKILF